MLDIAEKFGMAFPLIRKAVEILVDHTLLREQPGVKGGKQ